MVRSGDVTIVAELPSDWAADLGLRLHPELAATEARLLAERTVELGHGIRLAHLRVPGLEEPRLGAWRTGGTDWLHLVALLPVGDAARHLGWLAHLAAGLHREDLCTAVRNAETPESLALALQRLLAAEPISGSRPAAVAAPSPSTPGMRLVVAILKDAGAVDHLLNRFIEREVRGATILDGRGMAEHLAAHLSLFAGFKTAFTGVGHSQVVLTVITADRTEEVLGLVREAGDLHRPGTGIAFALDLAGVVGFAKLEASGD